jgi:hypothetical protein
VSHGHMQVEEEITEFVCSARKIVRCDPKRGAAQNFVHVVWQTRRLERGRRKSCLYETAIGQRFMKPSGKVISTALLLIGCASTASAQGYWYSSDGLKQRGYYGTPYGGGPQYGSGGGDQYGYGPAYSYAKQAPSVGAPAAANSPWYRPSPLAPPLPCVWRRVWNGHHWFRSCV